MKQKVLLLMVLALGMCSINMSAQTSVKSSTNGNSKTKTYNDVLAFDLKGKVKKCITKSSLGSENTIEFERSGKYIFHEFAETEKRRIYDTNTGRLIQIIFESSKYNDLGYKYEYNSNGLLVKKYHKYATWSKDNPKMTTIYEYTYQNGVVVTEKYKTLSDSEQTSPDSGQTPSIKNYKNYKYDSHGNWIHRESPYRVFGQDKVESEDRTIEYY